MNNADFGEPIDKTIKDHSNSNLKIYWIVMGCGIAGIATGVKKMQAKIRTFDFNSLIVY